MMDMYTHRLLGFFLFILFFFVQHVITAHYGYERSWYQNFGTLIQENWKLMGFRY